MAALADALDRDDLRAVFGRLDRDSREALYGIAEAAREQAAIVRADYPPAERDRELRRIEADVAPDGVELFARRCPADCRRALREALGAVVERKQQGEAVVVRTATGGRLRWRKDERGRYRLLWRTEALVAERDRAFQALRDVRRAAELHRRRRRLQQAASPTPPQGAPPPGP